MGHVIRESLNVKLIAGEYIGRPMLKSIEKYIQDRSRESYEKFVVKFFILKK